MDTNITQSFADQNLKKWQELPIKDRDRIISDVLFVDDPFVNIPRFSENFIEQSSTDKLISKLVGLGLPKVEERKLPRSSLSSVKCGDVVIPPMPYHKAAAFIAYLLAVSSVNNDKNVKKRRKN